MPSKARILIASVFAVVSATAGAATPTTDEAEAAAPTFEDCTIGDGRTRVAAQCADIAVPLDHEVPDGATLMLAVARLPGRDRGSDEPAFTLIAGGPGQSARDSWAGVAFAFRHIARDRDVILVDQRGTGGSAKLACPETDTAADAALDAPIDLSPVQSADRARDCLASLEHDPRLFTSSVSVRDLEHVRARLGVSSWHLYGVSYGTRVAQHYARRYPERVRTMILDAVVPPDRALGPEVAPFADRALDLVFARCAADTDCNARFPSIGSRTRAWLKALRAEPISLTFEDLALGGTRRTTFTADRLAALLRLTTYNAMTAALLPSMLDAAIEQGDVAPLVRQVELQARQLGDTLASGMQYAVVCTEDAPRMAADAAADSLDTYLGPGLVEALRASCKDWPAGRIDPDFFERLESDIPTLLLSGEADPITPPAYGQRVSDALTRARHVVVPAQGHMQAALGCMPVLMARFVASADPASLDTDCLERLVAPPFFIDANGPMP